MTSKAEAARLKKIEAERSERRENTGALAMAVLMAVDTYGLNAAREVVPSFADLEGVPELADALAVNRSGLWQMLGFYRAQSKYDLRRQVEAFLNLSPGGLTEVLQPIESLVMENEEE